MVIRSQFSVENGQFWPFLAIFGNFCNFWNFGSHFISRLTAIKANSEIKNIPNFEKSPKSPKITLLDPIFRKNDKNCLKMTKMCKKLTHFVTILIKFLFNLTQIRSKWVKMLKMLIFGQFLEFPEICDSKIFKPNLKILPRDGQTGRFWISFWKFWSSDFLQIPKIGQKFHFWLISDPKILEIQFLDPWNLKIGQFYAWQYRKFLYCCA